MIIGHKTFQDCKSLVTAGNKITTGNGYLLLIPIRSELASIASQEGRYVLPQRVALEINALLSQPIGVEFLSTRCFRKQHVAYIRSDTTRCFHF